MNVCVYDGNIVVQYCTGTAVQSQYDSKIIGTYLTDLLKVGTGRTIMDVLLLRIIT